jgi:hypothetical protein
MDKSPKTLPPKASKDKKTRSVTIIAAKIGAIAVLVAAIIAIIPKVLEWINNKPVRVILSTDMPAASIGLAETITILPNMTPSPTLTTPALMITEHPALDPTQTLRVCKPIDPSQPFSVINNYGPTGLTGDIGDIIIIQAGEAVQFKYITNGLPDHEWDYKYINKVKNDQPAKFGGVIFQNPPNNSGTDPTGGFDLRQVKNTITWEARSLQGDQYVQFFIGGVNWIWNEEQKIKETPPYPDTLPRLSLGNYLLTSSWQTFSANLAYYPDDYFGCVLGGFGWIITWGSTHPETYVIEVRNIYYQK